MENDFDKFLIEDILETFLSIEYIFSTKSSVRIDNNRNYKNIKSYFPHQISEPKTITVNIFFTISLG